MNSTAIDNISLSETTISLSANCTDDESFNLQLIRVSNVYMIILEFSAALAILMNTLVLTSVFWIRRPFPPALKISLSLAVCDAYTSMIYTKDLMFPTAPILIEILRLSGVLITVMHLFAISLNYHLGILKPLHYNIYVTKRRLHTMIVALWIFPHFWVAGIFTIEAGGNFWTYEIICTTDNLSKSYSETLEFLYTFRFRMLYAGSLLIPIILMVICFTHILIIIQQHTSEWVSNHTRGNIKAINTTLLIIGSCFLGWMPAILLFIFMCKINCYISGEELITFRMQYQLQGMTMRLVENELVILKMLINPVIYCIRMKEIQEGMRRMYYAIRRPCCPVERENFGFST